MGAALLVRAGDQRDRFAGDSVVCQQFPVNSLLALVFVAAGSTRSLVLDASSESVLGLVDRLAAGESHHGDGGVLSSEDDPGELAGPEQLVGVAALCLPGLPRVSEAIPSRRSGGIEQHARPPRKVS